MLKYTILYFHILWTRQQPPPACLRSLPVLAAARMTHSSRHKIVETFDSIHTLWAHRTNTDSNIPVAPNHQDGEDLYRTQGINLDHSYIIGEPVYIFDNCLQDNQIMQEIVNTCIDVCTVVFIIVSTVSVTLLSIILVIFKNLVITQEFKDHIKMIKQLQESAWEPEPLSADT